MALDSACITAYAFRRGTGNTQGLENARDAAIADVGDSQQDGQLYSTRTINGEETFRRS